MNSELAIADDIKKLTAPVLEKGFVFEYLYQKGGDSSCVYICRYRKGKDYFDWRETSGGNEINIVSFVNGEYNFPSLKTLYPKEHRAFAIKHLLKKATMDEKRVFTAGLIVRQLTGEKSEIFGIKL
ncbi:MAG: hypothetical protein IKD47_00050 [Clostridia bacterium]|jgi:hypothetical protein|nr:hypothetical protein [Clostridia bacterium]